MAGFGRAKFGKGPFGKSDLGKDLIVNLFNSDYLGEGLDPSIDIHNNSQDPILKFLKMYAYSINKRRNEIDGMPSLTDPETAPSDILILLGEELGLGVDKNDPLFLQRSFVGNASQWLQIKASTRGYQVRGLASGFDVSVENFWRIDPIYSSMIPLRNQFYLKPKDADPGTSAILHTDVPPGSFPGTPVEEDGTYAKSAYIRVVFTVKEPRRADVDYNTLLDLVISKIKDVVGLHHEMTAPQFLIKIEVDARGNARIDQIHEDVQRWNWNFFKHYDLVPADVNPLDFLIVAMDHFQDETKILIIEVVATAIVKIQELGDINQIHINPIPSMKAEEYSEIDRPTSITTEIDQVNEEFAKTLPINEDTEIVQISEQMAKGIDENAVVGAKIHEFAKSAANETVTPQVVLIAEGFRKELSANESFVINHIQEYLARGINDDPSLKMQIEEALAKLLDEFAEYDIEPADTISLDVRGSPIGVEIS